MLAADPACPTCGPGYLFYATPAQKANAGMYAGTLPKASGFYQTNGLAQPTLQHILNAAASDGVQRNLVAQRTVQAAMAAGTLALVPGLAGGAAEAVAFGKNPVGYCLSNPAACTVAAEAVACTAAAGACPVASLVPNAGKVVTAAGGAKNALPSSRLSQAGGLEATEGSKVLKANGQSSNPTHPLAKHGPDVTDQYIYNRVANELAGNNRTGLRTAFNDRAQMENAIAETFVQKQAEIKAWIASGPRAGIPKSFEANPGMGNLGRGFEVTTPGGSIVPITNSMPNVNLVLMPNGRGGYLIHTAHPF